MEEQSEIKVSVPQQREKRKEKGKKGIERYPCCYDPNSADPCLWSTFLPAGSGGARPVSQEQWGQSQCQPLPLRMLHGTQSFSRQSQADGPHLVARVSVV